MSKQLKIPLLLILYFATTFWLYADAHIFVYHRFGDSRHPSTNTSLQELRNEFNYFKKNGYQVVKLETLVDALKKGEEIPDNWVVLTIDDNFKTFYTNGLPIFKEFGYPFTVFVYLEATEKKYPDYTTFAQLREISKYGSLGYHSYGHAHMTTMSDEQIHQDFKKGLELFKTELGITPKYFVYPYGEYDENLAKISKEYGFEAVLNQNMGAVTKGSDIFDLDRSALVGNAKLKTYLDFDELQEVEFLEPTIYPKDRRLTQVKAKVNPQATKAVVYISGHGWHPVKVKEGIIDYKTSIKLTDKRIRVGIMVGTKLKVKVFRAE
ncbi:MAG: polysaccharide deacetylase family protein [Campylobacterales bacterium]|nr:polysaccharide deacetylase family protein [Campylobacterales bacterium]